MDKIDIETARLSSEIDLASQREAVNITFKEGETAETAFVKLANSGVVDLETIREFSKNPSNFDRETYPFLPSPLSCTYGDITGGCALYYSEGYIYPDTYAFFKDSTPNEVYAKFFNNFRNKVWNQLDTKPAADEFQQAVIMASVIEKETGRPKAGVNSSNLDEVNQERRTMSGVFYNRIDRGMKWQSDVTVEYGQQSVSGSAPDISIETRRLCQQTLTIDNCLFLDSPEVQTGYNTYKNQGYPVAPVTSPQFDNIFAALNPTPKDNIFFLSDATGKKYFYSNNASFEAGIVEIQRINRSLGVE